jgi:hypothetical protein
MKHPELVRQHAVLRSLIKRAGHDPSTRDLEMLAHWGRYLCVLTAGFVENTVRFIYGAHVVKTSSPQTARYAVRKIEEIQNPKASRLIEIARAFDKTWGANLEMFLEENFRKDAINTIMANRHLIAHGKDSDITIARVAQYLSRIVEVVDYLEQQCGV